MTQDEIIKEKIKSQEKLCISLCNRYKLLNPFEIYQLKKLSSNPTIVRAFPKFLIALKQMEVNFLLQPEIECDMLSKYLLQKEVNKISDYCSNNEIAILCKEYCSFVFNYAYKDLRSYYGATATRNEFIEKSLDKNVYVKISFNEDDVKFLKEINISQKSYHKIAIRLYTIFYNTENQELRDIFLKLKLIDNDFYPSMAKTPKVDVPIQKVEPKT